MGLAMAHRWQYKYDITCTSFVKSGTTLEKSGTSSTFLITCTTFLKICTTFPKTCSSYDKNLYHFSKNLYHFFKSCTTFPKTCSTFLNSYSTFDKTGTSNISYLYCHLWAMGRPIGDRKFFALAGEWKETRYMSPTGHGTNKQPMWPCGGHQRQAQPWGGVPEPCSPGKVCKQSCNYSTYGLRPRLKKASHHINKYLQSLISTTELSVCYAYIWTTYRSAL